VNTDLISLMRYRFPYLGADVRLTRPQSDTMQLTLRDHGYELTCHVVCLFTPLLSLVLISPTHEWMARLIH